ncbi:dihydrofolate reductase [Methylobacillus flagellatus]|uniref:dihydrofolate reductase n=1 Tax=Methylobacillus flagellatus TaxID=405 RepID=UPI0010F45264|nr:dihydrofolate reductase [Methylobacillus flagellatus]
MSKRSLIVAMARNRVIGVENRLPWHLPEDLKRFRALTTGHHIIMGRKTYESLNRLLPDRTTVIVTRNPDYQVPGALVVGSLAEALAVSAADDEAFVIGGAQLYAEALENVDRIYLTELEADYAGDTWLPEFDADCWQETQREAHVSAQGIRFSYVTLERR